MTCFLAQGISAVLLIASSAGISVQVVDELWIPIPGVDVRIEAVNSCANPKPAGSVASAITGRNGEVQLSSDAGVLLITASSDGFERRQQCVQLGRMSPDESARVQLRLRADLSKAVMTHSANPPLSGGQDSRSFGWLDFVGVYRDSAGLFYGVTYSEDPPALALSLPTGSLIYFRERSGLTFRSPQGVLVFRAEQGRLAGLTFTPSEVRAAWFVLGR